nr:hypothetical protein [Candidatus Freyrarchaeum guaymaensis]
MAVEPNGMRLPSSIDLMGLGAWLPSPRRALRKRFQQAATSRVKKGLTFHRYNSTKHLGSQGSQRSTIVVHATLGGVCFFTVY